MKPAYQVLEGVYNPMTIMNLLLLIIFMNDKKQNRLNSSFLTGTKAYILQDKFVEYSLCKCLSYLQKYLFFTQCKSNVYTLLYLTTK